MANAPISLTSLLELEKEEEEDVFWPRGAEILREKERKETLREY